MNAKLPPSRVERSMLVRNRKRDLPRPGPKLTPKGLGSTDPALTKQRRDAKLRELRIKEIDTRLNRQSGRAIRAFDRGR